MLNSLDCKIRAAECEKMADGAPKPASANHSESWRVRGQGFALEAEQTLKKSRPPLQLIVPNPLPPPASRPAPPGS